MKSESSRSISLENKKEPGQALAIQDLSGFLLFLLRRLTSAFFQNDCADCLETNLNVQSQAALFNVPDVRFHPLVKFHVAAPFCLTDAGESALYQEPFHLMGRV